MSVASSAGLRAAVERGIFQAIHDQGPLTLQQVADSSTPKLSLHSASVLLDLLATTDWVQVHSDGRYTNVASVTHHLIAGLPPADDLRPIVSLFASPNLMNRYAVIGDALDNDGATDAETGDSLYDHPWWTYFSQVTAPMVVSAATSMMKLLPTAFPTNARVLDVATGSGGLGFTLVNLRKDLKVSFLDFPNVISTAKGNAASLGVDLAVAEESGRVKFVEGSAFEVDLQGPYETIITSQFFHHFTREECIAFMRRARAAAKEGGHLVVHDFVLPSKPFSLASEGFNVARIFRSVMLVWTRHGAVFTEDDYRGMLAEAGWKLEKSQLNFPITHFLLARAV